MDNTIDHQLANINRRVASIKFMGSLGAILLGLGLMGLFGNKGEFIHPILGDVILYGLLMVGGIISIVEISLYLLLMKRKSILEKE